MSTPQKFIIDYLKELNYKIDENIYNKNFYDDSIFSLLENIETTNEKGGLKNPNDFYTRFRDIISDPNNLFIERVPQAGKLENGIITLHNGIQLYADYYGEFIKILKYNLGVHEPSEERAFDKVLSKLSDGSVMIELGSYWSWYSIWFSKFVKNSKVFCVEPDENNIKVGIKNFVLNNLTPNFIKGKVSNKDFNPYTFFVEKKINNIDIVHCDIQGYELEMLEMIQPYLVENKIKYIFISTHSNKLHYDCINFLEKNDYKILCSCDFDNQTFQYDGFLLSCPNSLNEILPFNLGNRSKSKLIGDDELKKIIKDK
jgi:hypothetical protein